MKSVCLFGVWACALFAQSSAVPPQSRQTAAQAAAAQQASDVPIVIDVTRVNTLFTVSDRKGRFVTNLTKDDFEVIENKKKQNILEFVAEIGPSPAHRRAD